MKARAQYRWPWFVAAALLVGIFLAVVAIRREVERVRAQKEFQQQFPASDK